MQILTYALPGGFISSVVTWLVRGRQRRNGFLAEMQKSIDLLSEKYNAVLQDNIALRQQKAEWMVTQRELLLKVDKLGREVEELRRNLDRTRSNAGTASSATPERPGGPRCRPGGGLAAGRGDSGVGSRTDGGAGAGANLRPAPGAGFRSGAGHLAPHAGFRSGAGQSAADAGRVMQAGPAGPDAGNRTKNTTESDE